MTELLNLYKTKYPNSPGNQKAELPEMSEYQTLVEMDITTPQGTSFSTSKSPNKIAEYISILEGDHLIGGNIILSPNKVKPANKQQSPASKIRKAKRDEREEEEQEEDTPEAKEKLSELLQDYNLSEKQLNTLTNLLHKAFIGVTADFLKGEKVVLKENHFRYEEMPLMESSGKKTEWVVEGNVLKEVVV